MRDKSDFILRLQGSVFEYDLFDEVTQGLFAILKCIFEFVRSFVRETVKFRLIIGIDRRQMLDQRFVHASPSRAVAADPVHTNDHVPWQRCWLAIAEKAVNAAL